MATRAHLREQITSDKIGALAPVPYATVSVYETGTTTPVAATMYQTATGVGVYTNPLTADANGVIEFWMTNAQVVDLTISAPGYNAVTVTAQVIGTDTATGLLNLNTTTTPASAGDVQIATDDFTWEGAGGLKTAVRLDGTQTVTGAKTATALTVADATDHTKTLGWDLSGATTGTKTTVKAAQTAARTVTMPDATDTLVGKATTDTLTNKTIDTAGPNTIKVNGNTLAATAGTATVTVPNSTDTLVGRATTDTLTNKTLTSPSMTSPVVSSGGLQAGVPTGGDKGTGTVNVAGGYYVNGVQIPGVFQMRFGTGQASGVTQNTTQFLGNAGITNTEPPVQAPMSENVTFTKMYASSSVAPSSGQSYTLTLRKNGVDQAITCAISGTATTANDTAHSVSFAPGDLVSVKVVSSATATNSAFINLMLGT